jgi:hypothetical protein
MECSTAGEGIIDHQRAPGVQNTWRPKDPLVGSPNPRPICPDLEAAGPPPSRGAKGRYEKPQAVHSPLTPAHFVFTGTEY